MYCGGRSELADPSVPLCARQLWEVCHPLPAVPADLSQLLAVPRGSVTSSGLHENVCVSLLFIHAWLSGRGQFVYRGRVEDSATAEISRSQLWQWVRHRVSSAERCHVFPIKPSDLCPILDVLRPIVIPLAMI